MPKIFTLLSCTVVSLCGSLFWQACNIVYPVQQPVTYVHIDSFKFIKNPAFPLAPLTHQIICANVYYNDNPIGTFDLPVTIPVMASGTGTLEVFPEILIDGQNDLLGQYPFYQADTFTFAAQPGKIITHECTTTYAAGDVIQTLFSFNNNSGDFNKDSGDIPIVLVADTSIFGGGYGSIFLSVAGADNSIDSTAPFSIPQGTAFIEFDYQNTLPFYVGLQSDLNSSTSSAPYYLAGVYPSSTWQKFYLKLADYTQEYTASNYCFYIKTSLPIGSAPGYVHIANVQMLSN